MPQPSSIRMLLAALFGALTVQLTAAAPIAIEDFARFEQLTTPSLSPDGKHVVGLFAAPGQKWPVLSIWQTDALDKPPVWIPSEKMRPVLVRFVGDNRLIFVTEQELTVGTRKSFTRKLYLTDLKGSFFDEPLRTRGATNDAVRRTENLGINFEIFSENLPDQNAILLQRSNLDQGTQEIWKLDTATGRAEKVAEGNEKTEFMSAGVSPWTGELLLRQEVDADSDGTYWVWRYFRKDVRSSWERLDALSYPVRQRRDVEPIGFDRNAGKLLVRSNAQSNHARVLSFDLVARKFDAEPLFSNEQFDISAVAFARQPGSAEWLGPVGITVAASAAEQVFVDDYWAPIHALLKKQYPGMTVSLGSLRRAAQMAIVSVESGAHPPEYFLLRAGAATSLAKLGAERPWINAADMGSSRWVSYAARDGLTIPGILTLPPGWKTGDKPVASVVLPHGGPWARDYMGWDGAGWPQFLASRGYAVLQPQYRGSAGLGLAHWLAGDENWGLKMQDDKDDGADWLVQQGIADASRLAIFGYSYGGFAAIAASVRPNGPYVCAIAGAGVASLGLIQNEWGSDRLQRQVQGWTVKGMNPIDNVAKADIPILLYHGDRDRQADTEHSRLFYRAMKNAKKDVEYVEIKEMWHTLPWRPEWHRETLGLIENYLMGPKCFGGAGKKVAAVQ
jgi:dipeptidyl aminopeptidase/acylaminoacyl peptidase